MRRSSAGGKGATSPEVAQNRLLGLAPTDGRGFDVVFDTIGGDKLERPFEAARNCGVIASILASGATTSAARTARACPRMPR